MKIYTAVMAVAFLVLSFFLFDALHSAHAAEPFARHQENGRGTVLVAGLPPMVIPGKTARFIRTGKAPSYWAGVPGEIPAACPPADESHDFMCPQPAQNLKRLTGKTKESKR